MKKIAFTLCAAALLGTMSSCSSDSDKTIKLTKVETEMTRTLMVSSNTAAVFTYDGKTVSNVTTATFENAPEKGTLTITPVTDEYYAQEPITVDFSGKSVVALDVQIAKKPTIEVSQEDMKKGQVVTNDAENQELTGVLASIAVPAETTITGNTTSPFSIVTFVPTEGDRWMTRAEDSKDGEANVLVIRCAADGAKFSEPVTVTLDIPESDGLDLYCMSEDGKEVLPLTELGGGKRSVKLSHFSDWITVMRATEESSITRGTPGQEITTLTTSVTVGDNIITYQSKTGAVQTGGTKSTTVTNYLKTKVGKYVVTNKTEIYKATAAGTITYRVIQPYEDCSYKSGTAKFTARVYSAAHVEVDQPQGGHSGGGGR